MEDLFSQSFDLLKAGQKIVMAVIVSQEGSAPRKVGTRCLIKEDRTLKGTIGGGSLEYDVIEAAMDVFKKGRSRILHFKLTGKDVAETQMICGGQVTVFLEPVFPGNQVTEEIFKQTRELIKNGKDGILLTHVKEDLPAEDTKSRALFTCSGEYFGASGLVSKEIQQSYQSGSMLQTAGFLKPETQDIHPAIFLEPILPGDILYIFGAGHISTFISSFASNVDFQVTVIDDRKDLLTEERFPQAKHRLTVPFEEAFKRISINRSSYLAIVTRGHVFDREVLRAALHTSPAYIGMIGSRKKRRLIYQSLMDEGISRTQLDQVRSPIGLKIGAETPEEIAVSIVAELIKVRSSTESGTSRQMSRE